jgi:hypothetical protein
VIGQSPWMRGQHPNIRPPKSTRAPTSYVSARPEHAGILSIGTLSNSVGAAEEWIQAPTERQSMARNYPQQVNVPHVECGVDH